MFERPLNMAGIFVTTTAVKTRWSPYALANYERILWAAEHDKIGKHHLAADSETADFVLFVESRCAYHFDIFASSLYKRAENRCFVFDGSDNSIPRIPGIYMGIPANLHGCRAYQYGFYIRTFDNGVLNECAPHVRCKYLFSFVGNVGTAPRVRGAVMNLPSQRAFLMDSSSGQSDGDSEYARIIEESKFVICPRGLGPSTWRVFETMRAGRVPVVVSDQWYPPRGPRWEEFALIIGEKQIDEIPDRLAEVERLAEDMGRKAYEEWKLNFSLSTAFNWIGDTLEMIQGSRESCRAVIHRTPLKEALGSPVHRRRFAREYARETLRGLKL